MPDLTLIITNQLSKVATETSMDLQGLVSTMKQSGMSDKEIKSMLMNDLTGGGRLFGNYRNQVKNTVRTGIGISASNGSRNSFESAGITEYRWVAVGDKSVCADCDRRSGEIESMDFWKNVGLPQSGFSICRYNCRCQLIPADYKKEDLDKPILKKPPVKPPQSATNWRQASDINNQANISDTDRYFLDIYTNIEKESKYHYKTINSALRSGQGLNQVIEHKGRMFTVNQIAERMAGALDTTEIATFKGQVHRGVRHRGKEQYDRFTANFRNKKQWSNKGFLSTSTDDVYANAFIDELDYSTRIRIKSKSGKYIDELTTNEMGEREVLFAPGKKFKILSFKEDLEGWNRAYIELEEIIDN